MQIDFQTLHPHTHPREKRLHPFVVVVSVLGAIMIAMVAIGIPVTISGYKMVGEAQSGRTSLTRAGEYAGKLDFANAALAVREAKMHFAAADRYSYAIVPFAVVPYLGEQVRGVRTLISSSLKTSEALDTVATMGESVLTILVNAGGLDASTPTLRGGELAFFKLPPAERRNLLAALDGASEKLRTAIGQIDDALIGFKSIPSTEFFAPFRAALDPAITKLTDLRGKLVAAANLADLLPPLSGYPQPRTYLVLLQNNTELRPTGGFIGTVGTVTIADGAATNITAQDVYAVDGPGEVKLTERAPAPLRKYLAAGKWLMRDANWSPDFPTAARKAAQLYNLESGGTSFDGVIAIDPTTGQDLLRIVGAIKIGSSTFNADNVTDEIEYQVEKGFDVKGLPVAQRKDVLIALVNEVFKRVIALPSDRWQTVVDAMAKGFEEKHILVAAFDPSVSSLARTHNWDGAVVQSSGDFFIAVDANLAALKTDSVIDRSVTYEVNPQEGDYLAKVTLRYRNRGGFSWKTTRYRTYTRVYVPRGSELLASSGAMLNDKILDPGKHPGTVDTVDELGLRSFGAFLSVEPGETRELSFTYRLPPNVVTEIQSGEYRLHVQKQPGTIAPPLTLDLNFGKKLSNATPPEAVSQFGDTRYRVSTDLRTDRAFTVSF
jgi:hypothetical protein